MTVGLAVQSGAELPKLVNSNPPEPKVKFCPAYTVKSLMLPSVPVVPNVPE